MANRGHTLDPNIFTIRDLQVAATNKLPKILQWRINGHDHVRFLQNCDFAWAGWFFPRLRDNEAAFNRYKIRPRILDKVSNIDTSTSIFGTKVAFPLGLSPAAMHSMAHPDAEIGTSRAAAKAGICMALSTYATVSMEDVIAQGDANPYAFQMSLYKNKEATEQLIRRAEAAGYKAIVLTVDAPVLGRRLNEYRNAFEPPKGTKFPNLSSDPSFSFVDASKDGLINATWTGKTRYHGLGNVPNSSSGSKECTRRKTLSSPFATASTGVIISNHGGRQLDGVPATLDALRECAPVAAGHIGIAIDGGIRRGTDIFKALALGAQHCFVGRIPIWGLAYNGENGVSLAINLLLEEFRLAMALSG
ncbi:hypothetical protein UA08_08452 [Talaromyces atroroseus]|uniref:FMN hydroxy acid dehydrogenase domain-containing protein n=1 Tax=Talaromyces atroroseus TaxID=1441469 RepID=A0A1Q5Q7T4_TALAT|nr:hypothetical protein UA08_08452 [Talaromyces atroroseus]OKL56285.1 hypothetical protein UA08_08452 [Talaromyces atroroseus]